MEGILSETREDGMHMRLHPVEAQTHDRIDAAGTVDCGLQEGQEERAVER